MGPNLDILWLGGCKGSVVGWLEHVRTGATSLSSTLNQWPVANSGFTYIYIYILTVSEASLGNFMLAIG